MLIEKLDYVLNENAFTRSFGLSLEDAPMQNVLIIGPSGSGKTAQIKQWVDSHQNEIDVYYIDASIRPHMQEINLENGKRKLLFGANEVEKFNVENKILIIDHFDLTDDEVRNELISLVRNREIISPYPDTTKIKVDKFWYIIATSYPESHFGYNQLTSEDKNSFEQIFRSIEFESTAKTEESYIDDVVNDIIEQLDEETKQYYASGPEYDHIGFGTSIRNEYLWNRNIPSDKHPDDLSEIIYKKLIEKLS